MGQGSGRVVATGMSSPDPRPLSQSPVSFIYSLIHGFFPFCKHSKFVPTSGTWRVVLRVWSWDHSIAGGLGAFGGLSWTHLVRDTRGRPLGCCGL